MTTVAVHDYLRSTSVNASSVKNYNIRAVGQNSPGSSVRIIVNILHGYKYSPLGIRPRLAVRVGVMVSVTDIHDDGSVIWISQVYIHIPDGRSPYPTWISHEP